MSREIYGHELIRPGFKYRTSKWDCSQIDLYEVIWDDLKGKNVSLLEFGIYYGESLRYWREFFGPESILVGADHCSVQERGSLIAMENTKAFKMEKIDQSDPEALLQLASKYEDWDIVVDDGSHDAQCTANTIRAFWPKVKTGGWYVIEDCGSPGMTDLIRLIMQELIDKKLGKGILFDDFKGFGNPTPASPTAFFKKSAGFTGLDLGT